MLPFEFEIAEAFWLKLTPMLTDAPRPGGPMTFSLEQILQLFAIACEPPADYDRPLSHWTARELADEMLKQGIVESISPRHVGRLLAEADLKPTFRRLSKRNTSSRELVSVLVH